MLQMNLVRRKATSNIRTSYSIKYLYFFSRREFFSVFLES